jgi:hypothetical protein
MGRYGRSPGRLGQEEFLSSISAGGITLRFALGVFDYGSKVRTPTWDEYTPQLMLLAIRNLY